MSDGGMRLEGLRLSVMVDDGGDEVVELLI